MAPDTPASACSRGDGEGVASGGVPHAMAYNGSYPPGYSSGGLGARGRGGHSGEVQLQMPTDFDMDDEVDKLHGKVSLLKQMTGAIHDESNVRGRLIDQLEQTMSSAGSAMKDAKRKIDKAFKRSGGGHLAALVFFCLFVFLAFYVLYKMGKFIRFFTG